ncbi:MAG: class I tRNA ligase family protein, partial [Oscillospiraceae bacterium]|nr:class I tRNA ligase family protein [Oscillospiraceae bacterium]
HDWCISRQLWWGHRIPAFYCDDCGEMTVSREDVTVCPKCGSAHIHQDPDVLDTWFSSALWPFSTLGWPDKTEELDYFYPTSVLVTGYDIITFWVSRMIFSGMEQMKMRPFDRVLIHGLVRDAQGRKMSKSLGNGIDPLEIIDKYGADALRFTLVTGNSPGNDMRFSTERVEASRNFCNKIWNAARFVLMNLDEDATLGLPEKLELEDRWILSKYNTLVREVTNNIEAFELGVASANLYDFIWDSFCDWYIELTKARLNDEAHPEARRAATQVLAYVLSGTMKLLHPFMPFLTEEIWQALPHEGESIMIAPWPAYSESLHFPADEDEITAIMDAIRAIRNRRAEMNVPPTRKAKLLIFAKNPKIFKDGEGYITRLAYASEIELLSAAPESTEGMVIVVTDAATLYLPMSDLVDVEAELARLAKERAEAENGLARTKAKLANESFTAKAPQKVVDMERARAEKFESLLAQIAESVKALEKLK